MRNKNEKSKKNQKLPKSCVWVPGASDIGRGTLEWLWVWNSGETVKSPRVPVDEEVGNVPMVVDLVGCCFDSGFQSFLNLLMR